MVKQSIDNIFGILDSLSVKLYKYLYTASIAKEAVSGSESNNGGILIIGMIIVIVGLIGFIITKNRN
ncbi:MAG: LPXTG cell wall anchor domain-containing protein [Bacilli bacterium]|nr:LPXTG cell wall anchor domain-containing protein [Bacilli bacterium]